MALTVRTKQILGIALCGDAKLIDELADKIETAAAPSTRLYKALKVMLPKKGLHLEFVAALTSGSTTLTHACQRVLYQALCDKKSLDEILAALA